MVRQQEFVLIHTDNPSTLNLVEGVGRAIPSFPAAAAHQVPEDSEQKDVFCLQEFILSCTILPRASQATSAVTGRSRILFLTLLLTLF